MVRGRNSPHLIHGVGGREALLIRSRVELEKFKGRYDGGLDVGVCLVIE